jgi:hypothetical protein
MNKTSKAIYEWKEEEVRKALKIQQKDIKTARRCIKEVFNCKNEDCINESCPLNKCWEEKEK